MADTFGSKPEQVTSSLVVGDTGIQLWISKYNIDVTFTPSCVVATVICDDSIFRTSITLDHTFLIRTLRNILRELETYYD